MTVDDVIDALAGFTLFGDLSRPELVAVAHTFDEEWFGQGQRILRQGFGGSGFYVILEGEAVVVIDGAERNRLARGDFFGEISVLLDEPPSADVVATTAIRCLVLPRGELKEWLAAHPSVILRMLVVEVRRLRTASEWRN